MAKSIVKAMTGIIVVLVIMTVYFIQVNDHKMIMLCAKLMLSVFVGFSFASFLLYLTERDGQNRLKRGKITKAVYLLLIVVLGYFLYSLGSYIITSSIRRDQLAGLNGNFFEIFSWVALGVSVLVVVLYNLREKRGRT